MQILCTNGFKSVMTELVPALERENGNKPALRWGSTAALLDALAGGASGDIVILTHEAIDSLMDQVKAVAGSRVDLARSGIGIAVCKGAGKPDISSPDALKRALLAARSVAIRQTGVSGIYFPALLERLGINEQMKGKLVMPEGNVVIGESLPAAARSSAFRRSASSCRLPVSRSSGRCPRPCRR